MNISKTKKIVKSAKKKLFILILLVATFFAGLFSVLHFKKKKDTRLANKKIALSFLIAASLTVGLFLAPVIAQQPGLQKIKNGLSLIFQEGRQWQIASDAISLRATGTYAFGTANLTPGIPAGAVVGDMMILAYGTKPYNDTPTINNGWTLIGSSTDGTVAAGANVGSMKTIMYYKIHTGSESNPTITNSTNNVSGAVITVFQKGTGESWETPVGAGGGDTTADTAFAATSSTDVGHKAGDMLVGYASLRDDTTTLTGSGITATGLTLGSFTQSPTLHGTTTSGGDMTLFGGHVLVTSGNSSAPPVIKATIGTAETGSAFIVRLRRNQSPTVVLNSPADASSTTDTTPTFDFTGTDVDSNDIQYNLQILGANLVTNASFETDAASTSPPTEWGNLNSDADVVFRGVSTDFAQSGSKSWKITSTTTGGTVDDGLQQTAGTKTSGLYIPVTPGTTYKFSTFIKTAITNSGDARIVVKLFKAGYANEVATNTANVISGTTDWTESSMEITIPADYVIAEIILCAGAYGTAFTGSVWFDNVTATPILYDKVSGTDAGFVASTSAMEDNFNDDSLNLTKWATSSDSGGTQTESGNKLIITPGTSGIGYTNVYTSARDFTDSYVQVKVTSVADVSSTITTLVLVDNTFAHGYKISVGGTGLVASTLDAGTLATVTYSSSTMVYWKIREADGYIYFEYSATGAVDSWTTFYSMAEEGWGLTGRALLETYEWASDATPGVAWYDDFIFGDTSPFISGDAVRYTVQTPLAGGSYYWRVRGKDPSGTNAYGTWATMRSLTITNASPTVVLNSPADASSTTDTTPTFDFTGTDSDGEYVRYNLQIFGANMITNPGFETDAGGTNPPTEWGNVNVVGATRGVATDFAHSGSKSWKISTTTPAADAGLQQTASTRTSGLAIAVTPGVTYRFSAFIKTAITNSGNAHIHVKLFKVGYTNETGYDTDFVTGTTDWTENSMEITIPADYVIAEVILAAGAWGTAFTGSVWFDDVIVAPILYDKVSGTDAGFVNPDVGGDTDPFTSGDNIQHTVQMADILTSGTYYWRVRGKDPTGTNVYGAWATMRSFTLTNTAPTMVLNTPADAAPVTDTTPTFDFTSTDAQADDVEYNIQIVSNLNPIAFVATSTSGALAATSSFLWNHTIVAGSNRILVVAVGTRDASSGVSGITYNSVALTKVRSDVHTFSPYAKSELWYLVNPDTGTFPITVTLSATADFVAAVASNWTGVDQISPILANNGSIGTSVSGTEVLQTISTTLDNSVLIESVYSKADPTLFTDKAGQTRLSKLTPNSNGDTFISSYKLATTASTTNSMAFTDTEGADYGFSVTALQPAVLISKFSTTDTGFVNPDVGGDTHPFISGDNIQYTVQAGDALTAGTYYWRVRGLDPSGTNTYGIAVTRSFTLSTNIAVSGTAYNYGTAVKLSACDASTTTYELALRVGGATYNASCSNADGTFSFSGVTAPSEGDGMVIWINGLSTYGATAIRYDGSGDSTGNSLYSNTVFVTSDETTTVTNTHLNTYDNGDDSDIPYTVTSSNLTVNDGFELRVASSKTFTPGGTVTTSVSGSSTSADGTVRVGSGGTLNMGSNNLSIGGNFYNSGTLTQTSATTTMTATSTGFVASSTTFAHLDFNGSGGGWTFTSAPTIAGNMTITAGTLSGTVGATVNGGNVTGAGTINLTNGTLLLDGTGVFGGSTAWTFYNLTFGDGSGVATTTKTGTASVTVSNVLTIAASQILNAGTSSWIVSGASTPFVIAGTFTASSSTFRYTGTSATNVATTTYYTLECKPPSGSPTYTILAGTLTVSNAFVVGNGSSTVTVTANTNDPTIDINGSFTVNTNGVYQASNISALTIAGHYNNSGTFTANSATTTFDGTSQQMLSGNMTGSNAFYTLKITNNSGTNPDTSPSVIFVGGASSTNFFAQTASTTIRFTAEDDRLVRLDSDIWETSYANGAWRDTNFLYVAYGASGLVTYSVDGSGNLTNLDSDDLGSETAHAVCGDGNFIYVAYGEAGLHSYSVDANGMITHIDSDDQGDEARGVWCDGDFIYVANFTGGIHTYSADSSGNLTHIDADDQGSYAMDIWGDGNFIYLANSWGGIVTYSVDGSGNLTYVTTESLGGNAEEVWGDGTYIYVAYYSDGLVSYSVDGGGDLTFIDSDTSAGGEVQGVWGDGSLVYTSNGSLGLHAYSIDGSGNITLVDSDASVSDSAYGVYADSRFVYFLGGAQGVFTYKGLGQKAGYTFTNFYLNGTATASRIQMRSSTSGSPWNLFVTGTQSVLYANPKDSDASGGNVILASDGTSLDGTGNTNWFFGDFGGRLFSSGFEMQSVTDGVEWTGGTVSTPIVISTAIRRSGFAAAEAKPITSGSETNIEFDFKSANTIGTYFARTYLYIDTLPTAENVIAVFRVSNGSNKLRIGLGNDAKLYVRDGDGLQIGSASSALTLKKWYRIEMKFSLPTSGTTYGLEAKINGTSFASGTSSADTSTGIMTFVVGANLQTESQTTGKWYFDDVAVNEVSGTSQNDYPGEGSIIHLYAESIGDNDAWTDNVAFLDEVTPDDASGYIDSSTANAIEDVGIMSPIDSGLSSLDTISLVSVGFRFNMSNTDTSGVKVRLKPNSGGTVIESSAITHNSTTWRTNGSSAPRIYPIVSYKKPTGVAWTARDLTQSQIGVQLTTDGGTGTFNVTSMWTLVEYVPFTNVPVSLFQILNDHSTVLPTGSSTSDGVTTNLHLDSWIKSSILGDLLMPEVEVRNTATSFTNIITATGTPACEYGGRVPGHRKWAGLVNDTANNRLIMFGGREYFNASVTLKNDVWEFKLSSDDKVKQCWRELKPTGTPPAARSTPACIYDEANQRMVCFGGCTDTTTCTSVTGGFYELTLPSDSDGAWTTLSPAGTTPSNRFTDAIYDALYDRMIIFGGWNGAADQKDLYSVTLPGVGQNGTSTQYTDAPAALEARSEHSLVYDSSNQTMVVFGGWGPATGYNDVWKLTLPSDLASKAWTELSPSGTAPVPRFSHEAIYDPINTRMVVFSGRVTSPSTTYYNDVFSLTLASGTEAWVNISPNDGDRPVARAQTGAVYDDINERMVVFGGVEKGSFYTNELLTFSLPSSGSTTPMNIVPKALLSARDASRMLYDSLNNQLILFGGYGHHLDINRATQSGMHTNEGWLLDIASSTNPIWRDMPYGIGPIKRELPSVVVDEDDKRLIVFGGVNAGGYRINDVWSYSLATTSFGLWTKLEPTGTKPAARWGAATIYDSANDRMLIFGGQDNADTYLSDVWELSLSTPGAEAWTVRTPGSGGPGAQFAATAVYDATNTRMLIFGGYNGTTYASTTYQLSVGTPGSESWTNRTPASNPLGRRGHTAINDTANSRMIMFGGYGGSYTAHYNDVWSLDISGASVSWTQLSPTGGVPAKRRSHTASYDPINQRMFMYGGRGIGDSGEANNVPFFNDLWSLSLVSGSESWTSYAPPVYQHTNVPVTSLAENTDFHWQSWAFGSLSATSTGASYGGNSDTPTAGIDFSTLGATAPSTLSMSLSANQAYFGSLSSSLVRFASSTSQSGDTNSVVAHTITASTTASMGYSLFVRGNPLSRGGLTISSIGASIASSTPGTEQFGLRATVSGGSGTVASRYSYATSYAYNATDEIIDTLASAPGSSSDVYSIYYMANIGVLTESGDYATALTYVITANY